MRLLVGQWEQRFTELLDRTEESILILSPFITRGAVTLLRPFLEQRRLLFKLITRLNLNDFLSDASDPKALKDLILAGVAVKSLRGLHAKVYIFDRKWAVLTSANLTGGGLRNDHEWGFLVSYEECPEIFEKVEGLWLRLARRIQPSEMFSIEQRLEKYSHEYPATEIAAEDALPDESESLEHDANGGGDIPLRSTASRALVGSALDLAETGEQRLAGKKEYQRLKGDLVESDFLRISVRSFLWLSGWCNTGRSYAKSSRKYIQPLAIAMFGYVPGCFLQIGGMRVNLKGYRYRSRLSLMLRDAIIATHRDRLTD
jgi:HKD family nuclease